MVLNSLITLCIKIFLGFFYWFWFKNLTQAMNWFCSNVVHPVSVKLSLKTNKQAFKRSLDSDILHGPWIDSAQMCHIASSSAAFLYLAWKFKTSVAIPHAAVKRQKFDLISHVNASKICTTLLKHTILSLIWDKGIFMIPLKIVNETNIHCFKRWL